METNTKRHPVLNAVLSILNVYLELVLALIALGFIIGLIGYLSA